MHWRIMLLLPFIPFLAAAQDQRGTMVGQVVDAATQHPLPGVNITVVERPYIGTTTNEKGEFSIPNVPVGEYSLRMTLVGYTTQVTTNVVVSTGRSSKTKIRMIESSVEMEGVDVEADYFGSAGSVSPVSTIGLSGAEVLRSPGANQDMQRIVQTLPSVATSTDQTNELIVRGGAPNENLTVMDYMEIPSTNHYPNEFNSGGPINMVNVDMIEDIKFSSGGFPAQYGDKLSSVMDVTIREGDRRSVFTTNTGMHFAGFGTLMEGRLDRGRGSWIVSARRSFLETIDNLVGMSSIGLTAIPKYYDAQFKLVYDLSATQQISLSGIYGNDKIYIKGDPGETDAARAGMIDSSSIETVDFKSQQYALGASLKSLWGSRGFSVLTLYGYGNLYQTAVNSDYVVRRFDGAGKVLSHTTLSSRDVFNEDSDEKVVALKFDAVYEMLPAHQVSFGGQFGTSQSFVGNASWGADTTRYDLNGDGVYEIPSLTTRPGNILTRLDFGDAYKISGYVSDKFGLLRALTVTAGIRYDYFSYSGRGNAGPRLSLSYELFPPTTRLNAAYGEYYQVQSYPVYSDNGYYGQTGYNKHLKNSHARHVVLGIEHIFAEGLKGTIEVYEKDYDDLPVAESFIFSADPTYRGDRIITIGRQTSLGVEIFFQQKQVKDLYGTLSFSYSESRTDDPRIDLPGRAPLNVGSYPSQYDYPVIATLVVGTVVHNVRTAVDAMPFYVRYPAMILPISDDMEFSTRFRYMSGNPYTPQVFVTTEQHREGGIAWSRGAWQTTNSVNSERYASYERLDVQWISRYHLTGWNFVVFLQIENVLNHDNIYMVEHRSDGTTATVRQYGFFPVGGLSFEF